MKEFEIISSLNLARDAALKKEVDNARKHYEKAIHHAENELKNENSEEMKIQVLTIRSEYLTFLAGFIFHGELDFDARNRAVEALNLHHQALMINTDNERGKKLAENERKLLNQVIKVFGCKIPENETHYLFRCPIRIRDLVPLSGVSPSIIYRDPLCNICNRVITDSNCIHLLGENYDGVIADIKPSEIEMLEVSLVNKPRDPNSRVETVYTPKEWIDKGLSQDELVKRQNGASMLCHYCREMKISPDEIDYDLFENMQKSDEISVPSNTSIEDRQKLEIKKDGLYFRTVMSMKDFAEPAKEAAKMKGRGFYSNHFSE